MACDSTGYLPSVCTSLRLGIYKLERFRARDVTPMEPVELLRVHIPLGQLEATHRLFCTVANLNEAATITFASSRLLIVAYTTYTIDQGYFYRRQLV
jgi:hypothetical protein